MTPGRLPRAGAAWARAVGRPVVLLAAAIVGFAGISFGLAALRALELRATALDLGLYEQALWTGAHGGGFYEAPDWQHAGFATFFEVHLSPLLAVLAPVYAAAPSALTLFAIQSAVVALAAVPIYLLARDHRGSTSDGLLAGGLYLAWAPLLAGAVFDFHLEAFVPVEILGFLWLWRHRRYVAGTAVVFLTACTAEFALPLLAVVAFYEAIRGVPRGDDGPGRWDVRLRRWLAAPTTWTSGAVVAVALVAWALVLFFQAQIPSFDPSAGAGAPPGLSLGGVSQAYSLSLSQASLAVGAKLQGWLFLYGLVGFLPWFAPRSQVTVLPVAVVSAFQSTAAFVTPGDQHAFLIAVPLFVGVVDGLPRLRRWLATAEARPMPTPPSAGGRRRRRIRPTVVFFGVLLVVNLVLSPVDPLVQNPGAAAPGYDVSLAPAGNYADALAVAHLVAPDGLVLASTDLFPLVADDANAYVIPGPVSPGGFSHLPFGAARLPPAVLLSQDRLSDVPTWLEAVLYNESHYWLCAVGWDAPVGAVLLFEVPFLPGCRSNATTYFGPPPVGPATYDAATFTPGAAGGVVGASGSAGEAIASVPGVAGNVWHGPYVGLAPGTYTATISVHAYPWATAPPPSAFTPVLELTVAAFGQAPFVHRSVDFGEIGPASWGRIIVEFHVAAPSVNVEFVGDQLSVGEYLVFTGVSVSAGS